MTGRFCKIGALIIDTLAACGTMLRAQDIWGNTFLLDVYAGSARSSIARSLSRGGYELSGGGYVDFRAWYTPAIPDTTVLFLRPISQDLGLIWGLSSGERGQKYTIDPALQVGFVFQRHVLPNTTFAIRASTPLFGALRERACTADYGAVGGVQRVNCRLAASILTPEQTLGLLANTSARIDASVRISLTLRF